VERGQFVAIVDPLTVILSQSGGVNALATSRRKGQTGVRVGQDSTYEDLALVTPQRTSLRPTLDTAVHESPRSARPGSLSVEHRIARLRLYINRGPSHTQGRQCDTPLDTGACCARNRARTRVRILGCTRVNQEVDSRC